METSCRNGQGRPPITSHAAIEEAAFKLFAERGFESTTMDDIALYLGIGRRTIFRYYPSKADIPWGRFDDHLDVFRERLSLAEKTVPLWESIYLAILDFNTYDDDVYMQHRERMRLILGTPSLQAHSFLMYQRWRAVVAEYVGERTGSSPSSLFPVTVGHISLGLALSAYEAWLSSDVVTVQEALESSMLCIRDYFVSTVSSHGVE